MDYIYKSLLFFLIVLCVKIKKLVTIKILLSLTMPNDSLGDPRKGYARIVLLPKEETSGYLHTYFYLSAYTTIKSAPLWETKEPIYALNVYLFCHSFSQIFEI